MKPLLAILLALLSIQPAASGASGSADPAAILEGLGTVGKWAPDGEPAAAAGEDLFLLINGGADIYHEYGFVRTVYQTYSDGEGGSINLELYEMTDSGAAFGIYTFKTGTGGTQVDAGSEGMLESYYLNFWKGRYLVTLIGLDSGADLSNDLIALAHAVDAALPEGGGRPPLASAAGGAGDIIYLRGNLALYNWYRFDTGDIFGVREGVAGTRDGHSILVLQYGSKAEASRWYENARSSLRTNGRFSLSGETNALFHLTGRDGHRIAAKQYRRWIVIALTETGESPEPRIMPVLGRLDALDNDAYESSPQEEEE